MRHSFLDPGTVLFGKTRRRVSACSSGIRTQAGNLLVVLTGPSQA